MDSRKQQLRRIWDAADWSKEDRDWLAAYLEGDLSELEEIAAVQYQVDLGDDAGLLGRSLSEEILKKLHQRLNIEAEPAQRKPWFHMKGALGKQNTTGTGALGAARHKLRVSLIAAAAVAAVTLGTWLYKSEIVSVPRKDEVVMNDIAPGKNGATITLANGKVIELSAAKSGVVVGEAALAYSDGEILRDALDDRGGDLSSRVSKDLAATTAKGQIYQFTLSDGTRVWLNADSKISFPSQFTGKQRKVLLTGGEAYFEVAKDKKHPFIVESEGQQVEVLGTHFNISSYADEGETKTTLIEGSVLVSSLRDEVKQSQLLKPKQQAILVNHILQVKPVDAELETAWKNGLFRFEGTPLYDIMQQLGRWYNLEVSYEGEVPKRTFNGVIKRNVNLSEILKVLEAGGVRFKLLPPLTAGGASRIMVMQ